MAWVRRLSILLALAMIIWAVYTVMTYKPPEILPLPAKPQASLLHKSLTNSGALPSEKVFRAGGI